jgi:hypothetical protein
MIKKKLVVANGEYQTSDGATKTRWVSVGALHEYEGRHYITLDGHIALPALIKEGDTRVFCNLFDPDPPKQGWQGQAPAQEKPSFDDDLPF